MSSACSCCVQLSHQPALKETSHFYASLLKTHWNASPKDPATCATLILVEGASSAFRWPVEQSWNLQLCKPLALAVGWWNDPSLAQLQHCPQHPLSSFGCSLLCGNALQSAVYLYRFIWTKKFRTNCRFSKNVSESGTCFHLSLFRNSCSE